MYKTFQPPVKVLIDYLKTILMVIFTTCIEINSKAKTGQSTTILLETQTRISQINTKREKDIFTQRHRERREKLKKLYHHGKTQMIEEFKDLRIERLKIEKSEKKEYRILNKEG